MRCCANTRQTNSLVRQIGLITKSNLILGMGEQPAEITAALRDLHTAGCDIITITQYLRPTPRHHPVHRWVTPEEFLHHAHTAEQIGFAAVMAGPLVRSSYRPARLYTQALTHRGQHPPDNLTHLTHTNPATQEASSLLNR
jgi:lipoic acid synthetase